MPSFTPKQLPLSPSASHSAISIRGLGERLKPLSDAFIKLVKMIIAPVIFLTIATGIAGMNDLQKVGRVAGKAMVYFLTFSTLALIVGLMIANVVQPGAGLNIDPASFDVQAASKAHQQSVTGFLMDIIAATIVGAVAEGDILQVLSCSVLFGIALAMVIPTGYCFNLVCANICMTLAALSAAEATNIDLLIGDRILLLLVAMLPSKGAARMTDAGFVILATTLLVVPTAPFVGMTLILGVDHFMSECRFLANVIGNAVASIVVARAEGEPDAVRLASSSRADPPALCGSSRRARRTAVAAGQIA